MLTQNISDPAICIDYSDSPFNMSPYTCHKSWGFGDNFASIVSEQNFKHLLPLSSIVYASQTLTIIMSDRDDNK